MNQVSPAVMQELADSLQLRRHELAAQVRQRLHPVDEQMEMALFNNYAIEADQAEASQLADTDIALLTHELAELRTVDAALARLQSFEYGTCARCGASIPGARLLAQPSAVMCLSCQAASEARAGHSHDRPAHGA